MRYASIIPLLFVFLSFLGTMPAAQKAGEAKAEEKTLNSQTDGIDVLARRRKELLLSDEWASKYPTKIIPDSDRKDINEAIWHAREHVMSYLTEFNSTKDEAKGFGGVPGYKAAADLEAESIQFLIAASFAISRTRSSFERPPTEEERTILDEAERNIMRVVSNSNGINYFDRKGPYGELQTGRLWGVAYVISMLSSTYPADSAETNKKRLKKNGKHIRKLIATIEKYQMESPIGLWNNKGIAAIFDGLPYLSHSRAPSAPAASSIIALGILEAERAGYSTSKRTLKSALEFVDDEMFDLKFQVPVYYKPMTADDVRDGQPLEKEKRRALGWYAGHVPIGKIDPKYRLPDAVRAQHARRPEESSTILFPRDAGELSMLVIFSHILKDTDLGRKAREKVWGGVARVIGSLNQSTIVYDEATTKWPGGQLSRVSFGGTKLDSGYGCSFQTFSMLIGRERYGEFDVYAGLVESGLADYRRDGKLSTGQGAIGENLGPKARFDYYAGAIEAYAAFLDNLYYQPIGKEGAAPESSKEGEKPVSGEAKPAPAKESPEEPKQPGEKPSEDKATKKE